LASLLALYSPPSTPTIPERLSFGRFAISPLHIPQLKKCRREFQNPYSP
jgi:hypothetical protein